MLQGRWVVSELQRPIGCGEIWLQRRLVTKAFGTRAFGLRPFENKDVHGRLGMCIYRGRVMMLMMLLLMMMMMMMMVVMTMRPNQRNRTSH